ncbi:glycosyltransferase [Chryseobacterium sp. NKUCC03_KSP]|uniref:glycosyltransferase n=1 Tax=Chryseobacterium sp. NKUCC03_KSP TaxID=2842125 RepID=UPI001C5AECD8|nr:glycosyltransferase [Chryseobacterium sp. NKUCC03_KSP]MBW3523408.1 glycosyltransferase [Chryseobacterium sp. NKUCC03_KSP]
MKLVFWQNIISPHQSYFFNKISSEFEVILIVEDLMSKERQSQGWEIPKTDKIQVIKIENNQHLETLIDKFKYEKNIFSGLLGMGYPALKKASMELSKYNKIYIICEAPILLGYEKYLRILKYKFLYYKCKNQIAHIFAMGELGKKFYSKIGFSNKSVTVFHYFIKPKEEKEENFNIDKSKKKYVFVGQLIYRKGIDNLINAFGGIEISADWELTIIGNGELYEEIKSLVKKNKLEENVLILGNKENSQVINTIKASDFLILPSRFDGWGAVVSEALSVGTKVICSNKCGSAILINKDNGYVYEEDDIDDLKKSIKLSLGDAVSNRSEIVNGFHVESNKKINEFVEIIKS